MRAAAQRRRTRDLGLRLRLTHSTAAEPPGGHCRGGAQHQQADGLPAEGMVEMSAYTATATREGRWWVIDVDGVGVTQSRTLAEAHTWAQGLVEAVTGEAGADVTVTPSLPDGTIDRVRNAQTVIARADAELRGAADEIREATRSMLRTGMSQKDVAAILGVSRQRVSQLLNA
jgi:hypothetical protein